MRNQRWKALRHMCGGDAIRAPTYISKGDLSVTHTDIKNVRGDCNVPYGVGVSLKRYAYAKGRREDVNKCGTTEADKPYKGDLKRVSRVQNAWHAFSRGGALQKNVYSEMCVICFLCLYTVTGAADAEGLSFTHAVILQAVFLSACIFSAYLGGAFSDTK